MEQLGAYPGFPIRLPEMIYPRPRRGGRRPRPAIALLAGFLRLLCFALTRGVWEGLAAAMLQQAKHSSWLNT